MEHMTIRKLDRILYKSEFHHLSNYDKNIVINNSKIKDILDKELSGRKFFFEEELSCCNNQDIYNLIKKYCEEHNIRFITIDEYVELCDKYLNNNEWKLLFKRYGFDIEEDELKDQALANDLGISRNKLIYLENHLYRKILEFIKLKDKEYNQDNIEKVRKIES